MDISHIMIITASSYNECFIMCTLKDVSVPIYTTILNDDGRYYIYKWDVVKHQYGDVPLNEKGFFDRYSANQAVELLNSEIRPLLLHLM